MKLPKLTILRKVSKIDKEIDDLLSTLRYKDPAGKDYRDILQNLEELYKIKNMKKRKSVSPDTVAVVAGNLVGILIILKHEQLHVITSKALNFVLRGRV